MGHFVRSSYAQCTFNIYSMYALCTLCTESAGGAQRANLGKHNPELTLHSTEIWNKESKARCCILSEGALRVTCAVSVILLYIAQRETRWLRRQDS